MSFWKKWLSQAPEPELSVKKSEAGSVVSAYKIGQPQWTPRNYERLSQESYVQNAIAMRCTKLIATSGSSVNWLLHNKRSKDEIAEHPILDLLNRPSPTLGGAAFFEAVYAYILLAGNSYIEAVGPETKPPKELWCLRPDRMTVTPGQHGVPSAYTYTHAGREKVWQVDPLRGRSNILHLKDFHPIDDWYGMSRIEAAAFGVDRHNAAGAHNKALLDNGARPSGALVFEPIKVDSETNQQAPVDIINKAFEELTKRQGGPENAGRPMVLNGVVKWLEMSTTPKDMDFAESKDDAARDICAALGVPHVLIVKGQSTYNNVKEAKLELYEDTVLPLVDMVRDELNNWLVPRFGDNLVLSPDLDSISALEPRREAKRKSTLELVDAGILDADEAREAMQYGPRDPNAVEKVDASVLTALVASVDETGITPLFRYMQSVGLVPEGMTEDGLVSAALNHIGDEEFEPDIAPAESEEDDDEQ